MGQHEMGQHEPGPQDHRDPGGEQNIGAEQSTGRPDAAASAPRIGSQSSRQARLPRPDGAARTAGRDGLPIPAAPAVEHDGWRTADTIDIDDEPPRRRFSFQVPPYMKVAAVIAVATSFGALAGTFAATKVSNTDPAPVVRVAPDDGALKATVADLQRDVTGLRTSLENSSKALQAQTAKLADRMERAEKAQAEPAQKLAKLGEAIERLERRTAQAATTQGPGAPPTTLQAQAAAAQAAQPTTVQASSVQAMAPPPAPALAAPTTVAAADVTGALGEPRAPAPAVVNGWVVRDVRRGIALIEGRYGLIEVETGDTLPGLGRIEGIRKQDGRWIVVTSRGLILAR
jgi:hypothetical protein